MKITIEDIYKAKQKSNYELCKGVHGFQTDCQCLGYDHICALAMLETGDSYKRIFEAKKKIEENPYYRGFQKGWDQEDKPKNEDEWEGYNDGLTASKTINWRNRRFTSDVYHR